ncbi:hypothetical protein [Clostridium argentinense]|uniref:hypothetical protein n=1 Tax=Clostridium argentinense TaxID=29341 RepID=UPI00068DD1F3|nr:hypothetical protein [Clostridium argentinense]
MVCLMYAIWIRQRKVFGKRPLIKKGDGNNEWNIIKYSAGVEISTPAEKTAKTKILNTLRVLVLAVFIFTKLDIKK